MAYAVHLSLIGKLVVDFLLVIIELFSLGAFVLSQFTRLTDRQIDIDRNTVHCVHVRIRTVKTRIASKFAWYSWYSVLTCVPGCTPVPAGYAGEPIRIHRIVCMCNTE